MAKEYASSKSKGFKNHLENIAIVGAGGHSGKYVADALLKNGKQRITAISRVGSTSKIPEGVTVKQVDYDNHASLVESLVGQDALVITMGAMAPPDQQEKLIKAAAEANVPWVLPNEFGGDGLDEEAGKDIMLGPPKKKVRDLIEKTGKSSWIGICCGFWYEYSLAHSKFSFGFNLKKREAIFYDDGLTRINVSTLDQVGRGTANLLGLKILPDDENDHSPTLSSFKNTFCYISSFAINQKEMLDSLVRVTGTSLNDWEVTNEPVKERYQEGFKRLQSGDRTGFMQLLYARNFYPESSGLFQETRGLDNDKLGLPKDDLDEYTKVATKLAESGYFERYGVGALDDA